MRQPASEITGKITAKDGTNLFYRQNPVENERARILLVHGIGEHCGRYAHVIDRLKAKGISTWTYDHRGHGSSDGKRGHVDSFSDYISDLECMLAKARIGMSDGTKFFLLGHSMGGLIVLNFAERNSETFDGIIASSPGLAPAGKVPVVKGGIGKLMSHLIPALSFDNELVPEHLSHESRVVDAYVNDPLVHRRITARWFTEFMSAMERTRQDASQVRMPLLMQVAGDDRIVHPGAAREFFDQVTFSDKTMHFYDGLYHEIYNETEADRNRVLSDLENWLDDHM